MFAEFSEGRWIVLGNFMSTVGRYIIKLLGVLLLTSFRLLLPILDLKTASNWFLWEHFKYLIFTCCLIDVGFWLDIDYAYLFSAIVLRDMSTCILYYCTLSRWFSSDQWWNVCDVLASLGYNHAVIFNILLPHCSLVEIHRFYVRL